MTIGEQLKFERKKLGLTQEKVAEVAGLSLDTVSRVENGRNKNPTVYVIRQLSKALNYYKFEL
jgi:transcriptional regulator with XRE-family HTH domain